MVGVPNGADKARCSLAGACLSVPYTSQHDTAVVLAAIILWLYFWHKARISLGATGSNLIHEIHEKYERRRQRGSWALRGTTDWQVTTQSTTEKGNTRKGCG